MKRILFILSFLCLYGCSSKDATIYFNKTFEEISSCAKAQSKQFCIVLIDSTQNSSKHYLTALRENYKDLPQKAIYNIVGVHDTENDWYFKWLHPVSLPLTCIFSPDGVLIDLIPGTSRETFLYTEEAVKTMEKTDFHFPNRFGVNKKKAIPLLNSLLRQKEYLNSGVYTPSEIDPLIDSLSYPYSKHLKLIGALMVHDTMAAQRAAAALLDLETPYCMELYKKEFITAKKVLNPDFNINTEPNIRVDRDSIRLDNCKIHERMPIDVAVYNDGDQPLKISKIHLSCSCLEQAANKEDIVIEANGSQVVKFYFTPENEGEVLRDIFIASNAINIPVLHINIVANVTK